MTIKTQLLTAALTAALGAAATTVELDAGRWLPLSGNWLRENGALAEFSDAADAGNRPLWSTAGNAAWRDCRFRVRAAARDGVGDIYLALRWQNQENCYAARYSDPHRVLELLKIVGGHEYLLARAEGVGKESPQKAPLDMEFSAVGNRLTVTVGDTTLSAPANEFATGAVALGLRYRQGSFTSATVELLTPEEAQAGLPQLRTVSPRAVFLPEEENAAFGFAIVNPAAEAIENATLTFQPDPALPALAIPTPRLEPGRETRIELPFRPVHYRSGEYLAQCELTAADGTLLATLAAPFAIAPPVDENRLPFLLWDGIDSYAELARLGFTASAAPSFFFLSKYAENPAAYLAQTENALQKGIAGLRYGVSAILKTDTRRYWDKTRFADLLATGPDGKLQLNGEICQNHPRYRELTAEALEQLGVRIATNPSIRYLLFDSETENEERKLFQCFHPACLSRAEKAGFNPLPAGVNRVWGMVGASLYAQKNHPALLPDRTPEFDFIRWWWLEGSGFVASREAAAATLKKHLPQARSFHDPILRNPPFTGRGRGMDFVSHWTYTNPTPLAVLENIDEMRAAEPGRPAVPNLQLFWYTNEVVGDLSSVTDQKRAAEEANAFAEARDAVHFGRFVTVSPDHLREALYLALSRPVGALMADGGSAVSDTPGTYAFTNRNTPEVLAEFSERVLKPYGPMLRNLTGSPDEVALLQSAHSALYGRTGNYGNANKYFADVYNSTVLAQQQPAILFGESLGTELDRFQVLIVADARYLSESEGAAIRRFLAAGKTVIVDPNVAEKFSGAIEMEFTDTGKLSPVEREAAWRDNAATLKKHFSAAGIRQTVASADRDLVISRRLGNFGDQAIFLVNDRREAGDYVGKYGKVLDAGVPRKVKVNFTPELFADGRVLYDPDAGRRIPAGEAEFFLEAGGGRILYLATAEITGLEVKAPGTVSKGESAIVEVNLRSAGTLRGTQSAHVEIRDSAGRRNARSGYYPVTDGKLAVKIPIAWNDAPGYWHVKVTDQVTGHTADATFQVRSDHH